jgi:hypothetical protein
VYPVRLTKRWELCECCSETCLADTSVKVVDVSFLSQFRRQFKGNSGNTRCAQNLCQLVGTLSPSLITVIDDAHGRGAYRRC